MKDNALQSVLERVYAADVPDRDDIAYLLQLQGEDELHGFLVPPTRFGRSTAGTESSCVGSLSSAATAGIPAFIAG